MDTSNARAEILARIQAANGATSGAAQLLDAAWMALPRDYVRQGLLSVADRLHLFEERLTDYGAHVFHASPKELPGVIERILTDRGKSKILIPEGLPQSWSPSNIKLQQDDALDAFALDTSEGVLTSATVAIAATGTIILQSGAGQGRRALSLAPDYHLCVVFAGQVVETVPEAFTRLAATSTQATTLISGPSATADIEMTRIQGVHGPRFLDVVLVR